MNWFPRAATTECSKLDVVRWQEWLWKLSERLWFWMLKGRTFPCHLSLPMATSTPISASVVTRPSPCVSPAIYLSRPFLFQYDSILTRSCGTVPPRLLMACCHLETKVATHACAKPSQNWAYCIPWWKKWEHGYHFVWERIQPCVLSCLPPAVYGPAPATCDLRKHYGTH